MYALNAIPLNGTPMNNIQNSLLNGPQLNSRQNIIAGPGPRDYFFHSPGVETPLIPEEGPFPVQGNIGSLVKQEATDFTSCTGNPNVGLGPNCVGAFKADSYTTTNTCGDQCMLKNPEAYGDKDFGFPEGSSKVTNAHLLHAATNIRAGDVGQSAQSGCIESVPQVIADPSTGTCILQQIPEYSQVGTWNMLPNYAYMVKTTYTAWNGK